MDNKTIIGYDILAKRAIETESGINIDDALNRITAFRVVRGEGEDHHPSSDVTVSTKILYYTKTDKGYIAWIWVDGEGWVSAGGVSNESWKAWSEEHGSSATNEDSVYIGENLSAEGDFPSYQFGHDNVVDGEVPEFVEPQEIVSMNTESELFEAFHSAFRQLCEQEHIICHPFQAQIRDGEGRLCYHTLPMTLKKPKKEQIEALGFPYQIEF